MDRSAHNRSVFVYVQALAGFLLGGVAAAVSMQMNIAALTGDCQYRALSPLTSVALMLLPVIGGILSYRVARVSRDTVGLYIISRIGAEFCIFIIVLILMHMTFITFFWSCNP